MAVILTVINIYKFVMAVILTVINIYKFFLNVLNVAV